MIQKKIKSTLVIGMMLVSIGIVISPLAQADPPQMPYIVYGQVFIDEIPAQDGIEVSILINGVLQNSNLTYNGNGQYIIDFYANIGNTATMYVDYYGLLTDNQTFTIDDSPPGPNDGPYLKNLHIDSTSPPANQPPNQPTLVAPSDGAGLGIVTSATLQVTVVDPDDEPMTVTFYNADGDILIGSSSGIASGATVSQQWSGLSAGTHNWYAIANDGALSTQSTTWSFATIFDSGGGGGSSGGGGGGSSSGGGTTSRPTADAGGPYFGVITEVITFDASGSSRSISYRWDFTNDGEYDTEWFDNPTATYSYSTAGDYTVKLQVKDSSGNLDTDTADVTISALNQAPTDPTVTGDMSGDVDEDMTFSAVSSDPDEGQQIKYHFKWGDETNTTTEFAANNTEVNATHNWSTAGVYVIKVSAEDSAEGLSGETDKIVFIGIDYIPLDEIGGYLLDNEKDGTYDEFYNTDTGEKTTLGMRDTSYLIDTDGDGSWDYIYDPDTGALSVYTEEEPTESDEGGEEQVEDNTLWYVGAVLVIIIILGLLLLGSKGKGKKEEPKKKTTSKKK